MLEFPVFEGNCPGNVSTDAKYRIRGDSRPGDVGAVVQLVYSVAEGERWYVTTRDHPDLVRMVDDVKVSLSGTPRGTFYINEYKQVIVPTVASDKYYYAGQYEEPLQFEMDGKILSGEPTALDGTPLKRGDTWDGPHPGIPYILTAGGNDIKYSTIVKPQVEKTTLLSRAIGEHRASVVAKLIRKVKGG